MDFKKEIKLKDLVPKRGPKAQKKPVPPAEEKPAKSKRSLLVFPQGRHRLRRACRGAAERDAGGKAGAPPKPPVKLSGAKTTRHKKLVGLKIGASALTAARVVNNGSAELVQVAQQALDPGVVVGGELREPEALAEALKLFFKDNKLPKQAVRLGIASNRPSGSCASGRAGGQHAARHDRLVPRPDRGRLSTLAPLAAVGRGGWRSAGGPDRSAGRPAAGRALDRAPARSR